MSDTTAVICDFCGSTFHWTPEQVAMDAWLQRRGSGLGAQCDVCGDKEVAILTAEYERMEAEERAEVITESGKSA